jgi:hypothetical protein
MSDSASINYSYWEAQYTEARFEDDPSKLMERIRIAETALLRRFNAILECLQ